MGTALASEVSRHGVASPAVLAAVARVDRARFVPAGLRELSGADEALPIGEGQTISQPTVVAAMTTLAGVGPGARVLEVGTGSGYQAAVLRALGTEVWSVERIGSLAARAAEALAAGGYDVHLRVGDGREGWPEAAPFDAILVTAGADEVPPALLAQLSDGGRLVMPVGPAGEQVLEVHTRRGEAFSVARSMGVRFVPLLPGTAEGQSTRSEPA